MTPNVIPVFAIALLAITVAGTLLILLGCRVTQSEMPGIGTAAWVNLTGVGAVCLVNGLISVLLSPFDSMFRGSSPGDAEQTLKFVRLAVQVPANIAILALTYRLLLPGLSYRRGLVIGGLVATGLAGVVFMATYGVSQITPPAPPTPEHRELRESQFALPASPHG